jgi:uncharacterized membrane protein
MSSGFITVLICAELLVVWPSAIVVLHAWRSSRTGKVATVCFVAYLVLVAVFCFTSDDVMPSFQEQAISFLGVWLFTAAILSPFVLALKFLRNRWGISRKLPSPSFQRADSGGS